MRTKRPNLREYLLNWINTHGGVWHRKVDLYFVGDEIEFSPESTGRALRDLAEENKISVNYYNGHWAKNLAKYSSLQDTPIVVTRKPVVQELPDGSRIAVYQ